VRNPRREDPNAAGWLALVVLAAALAACDRSPDAERPADNRAGEENQSESPPDPAVPREMLAALEERVATNPSDLEGHRLLGLALGRVGREAEAVSHVDEAARLGGDDPDALLRIGMAYSAISAIDKAQIAYERLLKLSPNNPKALNNLGNVAIRRGDQEKAIAYYRQAVEADPRYLMAYHRLAGVLKLYGRLDDAADTYGKMLALQAGSDVERAAQIDGLCQLASVEMSRGAPEQAETLLIQALRQAPDHPSAHYTRAQVLIRLGREAEAETELLTHMRLFSRRRPTGPSATAQ